MHYAPLRKHRIREVSPRPNTQKVKRKELKQKLPQHKLERIDLITTWLTQQARVNLSHT